jgi:acetyl esterase
VDAQAKQVLDEIKALSPVGSSDASDEQWLANFRCQTALLTAFGGTPEPIKSVSHLILPRADGALSVRLYRPREGRLPVIFHIRGGGGIAGTIDGHDTAMRALANRSGWLVAVPDYRLAPAHRFPSQLDDARYGLSELSENAADVGIDASRIVLSGDSIGGTIAAALAMQARQCSFAIAGLILLYPNTDLRRDAKYPSRTGEDGNIIDIAGLERQISLYLASETDRDDPFASPILARDLEEIPPTILITGGADPLRDEGEAFVSLLRNAGVAVDHERFEGMIHAFLQMRGSLNASDVAIDRIAKWLSELGVNPSSLQRPERSRSSASIRRPTASSGLVPR